MKHLLFIIFLLAGFTLTAQTYHPFPTKNALWTEMYYYPDKDAHAPEFHCYALKDNDTTINGKLYHKLYHSTDTIFTESKLCGGIREENKRIYFYAIDSITLLGQLTFPSKKLEIILFDFSLKLGDTIRSDQFNIGYPDKLIVAIMDSTLVGTQYRKTLTFGYTATIIIPWAKWVVSYPVF
jgi:hypothetical protein